MTEKKSKNIKLALPKQKVELGCSTEASRPVLTAIHFKDGRWWAADGFALVSVKVPEAKVVEHPPEGTLVPAAAIKAGRKEGHLHHGALVDTGVEVTPEGQILYRDEFGWDHCIEPRAAAYPDVSVIIPIQEHLLHVGTVDARGIWLQVQKIMKESDDLKWPTVVFRFDEEGKLTCSVGETNPVHFEPLDVGGPSDFPPGVVVALNAQMLERISRAISDPTINRMTRKHEYWVKLYVNYLHLYSPVRIEPTANPDNFAVQMPMQLSLGYVELYCASCKTHLHENARRTSCKGCGKAICLACAVERKCCSNGG